MPELTVVHTSQTSREPIVHTGDPRVLKNLYDALYRPYEGFVATVKMSMGNEPGERGTLPAEEFFYPE